MRSLRGLTSWKHIFLSFKVTHIVSPFLNLFRMALLKIAPPLGGYPPVFPPLYPFQITPVFIPPRPNTPIFFRGYSVPQFYPLGGKSKFFRAPKPPISNFKGFKMDQKINTPGIYSREKKGLKREKKKASEKVPPPKGIK